MIEFTREEVVQLLLHLSRIDGYLLGEKCTNEAIHSQVDYPIELLVKKLEQAHE